VLNQQLIEWTFLSSAYLFHTPVYQSYQEPPLQQCFFISLTPRAPTVLFWPTMSVVNTRSVGRNVHIYDAREPNQKLGGLLLTNGVTNENLYYMINIILIVHGTFILQHNSNDLAASEVPRDNTPLLPGNYYIVTAGKFLSLVHL